VVKFKHNGEEYPPYVPPSEEKLLRLCGLAEKAFAYAINELGLTIKDYYLDFNVLYSALIRTDQRVLHYLMYHNGMKMNELKQIAVFSYWILRFKPINRMAGGLVNLNEQIVISWIFKSVKLYRAKKNIPAGVFSDKLKSDLLYALTYRDISYDYMTMLIEGLVA